MKKGVDSAGEVMHRRRTCDKHCSMTVQRMTALCVGPVRPSARPTRQLEIRAVPSSSFLFQCTILL